MRDAGLEVSIYRGALPEASSAALAALLLGKHTSPTQAAVCAERMVRLQEELYTLDAMDREVLSLRNFEEFSLAETALSLGIEEVGRRQARLHSCSQETKGNARQHAGRTRQCLTRLRTAPPTTSCSPG